MRLLIAGALALACTPVLAQECLTYQQVVTSLEGDGSKIVGAASYEGSLTTEMLIAALAVISGAAAWIVLPRRVDELERRLIAVETRVATESNALAEVKAVLDLVRERTDAIAAKLNVN